MAEFSYPGEIVGVHTNVASLGAAANYSGTTATGIVKHGDFIHGGDGTLTGTVKEQNTPANTPLRRKVRLFREVDGLLLQETWSDATTGVYTFSNLQTQYKYTVVSYDYTLNYRAVIADNLSAT